DYLLVAAVFLPLDIYFDYFHEHRFGLSRYTPLSFAGDQLKATVVAIIPTVALAFGLFGLARRLKRWWLVLGATAAVALLASAALDPYRAQVFFKHRPLEAGALRDKITALMRQARVDFSDVVVEDSSRATVKVQAYFAGQGPTRTIVLNDSLLAGLTPEEILGAVAHEAAHTLEPRWPGRIASSLALFAFLFLVDRLLRLTASRGWLGLTRFADIRTLPLVTLLFYLASGIAKPISSAFSRERERQADLYALRLTHDPTAFRGMLVKAARINKMDPSPPAWVVVMGTSHPPIADRIAAVDRGDWKKEAGDR
ncbi:MAG: M48 family metalloprotease, partial [Myxococcaceae bacterium]